MSLYRIAPDGEGARLVACMPRTSDAYAVAVKAVTVRAIVCFVLTIASFVVSAVVGAFDATLSRESDGLAVCLHFSTRVLQNSRFASSTESLVIPPRLLLGKLPPSGGNLYYWPSLMS